MLQMWKRHLNNSTKLLLICARCTQIAIVEGKDVIPSLFSV